MKRIAVFSSILAVGLLSAAPAFAAESATPEQPPSSTSTPVPSTSDKPTPPTGDHRPPKPSLTVLPRAARAGDSVTARVVCPPKTSMKLSSPVVTFGELEAVGTEQPPETAYVHQTLADVNKNAKPGTYTVTFLCGKAALRQSFKVLPAEDAAVTTPTAPKQVTKVPVGAPQTGGTDGPVDDSSSGLAVAAGAMGVLAVGGAGMVLARRRSRG
ncbi:hypothetical protein AB0K15_22120 [Amycolatopsis sp. NPDC049253]|uniref:hypothetical protein n=1 Tax=Amycolatopsis sp. NPDC049253 TaxID=3155274 RepID=UPI0034251104